MFLFVLQFLFYYNESFIYCFLKKFLKIVEDSFSYRLRYRIRSIISIFTFLVLLTRCFGGYFVYSFCPCGMVEFTFVYAVTAWIRTLLTFISREKFSVYIRKGGDTYLKTLRIFLVELVREFSRPLALTVRLTVNIIVGHMIRIIIYKFLEYRGGEKYFWLTLLAILMECFVFFIQSYIFSRLIFLYLNEWNISLILKYQTFNLMIVYLYFN